MNTQLKKALQFGLIGGLVVITSWWITQLFFAPAEGEPYDFSQGEFLGYLTMILALSAVFIGVKNYRDTTLGGVISFKKAFFMGLYIVLVASGIYVVGWMIYYPNFMPDFMDQYAAHQMQEYAKEGMSAGEIAVKQQEMKDWMELYENPLVMAGLTFMEIFPVGFLISAISAVILKKKK
ncbi:DUF4199 domain-containing protein [Marinoscillum sp.]|uniref:DUF4199 domain-containing protein n=1 Tax=Marinoscillum sp. TaxID=2024838 RepID=UPI003BAC002C